MAAKKLEFTAKNAKAFNTWLKKFSTIDSALLLEIDEAEKKFLAKTYNEERSVVKLSSIKFDEAGFTVVPNPNPQRIKVGIYNISRLMKVIDQFNDNEFTFTFVYDEVAGEVTELAGTSILLKNKSLKMNVECTSLKIFKYITDDIFATAISSLDEVLAKFNMTKVQIEQTNSLCNLDNENKFMEFKQDSKIFVAGGTFELDLGDPLSLSTTPQKLDIFKEQFDAIDVEDYTVEMGDDRLVFTSNDFSTTTVISMVEKD